MDDNVFYLVEYPAFHGGNTREYQKVTADELLQYAGDKDVVVYRVENHPLVIKADLHLERKEVRIGKEETEDTTKQLTQPRFRPKFLYRLLLYDAEEGHLIDDRYYWTKWGLQQAMQKYRNG